MEKQKEKYGAAKAAPDEQNDQKRFFNGRREPTEASEYFFPGAPKAQKTGNMPDQVLSNMEKLFEEDFSDVRVEQNSIKAQELNAVAFTQGDKVAFAPGYDPYSPTCQEFLGHELAHVIQQRSGQVETTHQELNLNVNNDHLFENQANEAGKRVASGQKAGAGYKNRYGCAGTGNQKKQSPIQLLRLIPAGAPIFELNINVDEVLRTFATLWNGFDSFGWLTTSFYRHPDLPDLIRNILGGNYFRGSNVYVSDWYDDGSNDWWNLSSLDNDVRIVMSLFVDNETTVNVGSGTFSSGGTTTDTSTSTTTTTVGGGATASVAPPGATGGVGGNVTANASVSQADSRSMAVSGTSGLSMASPAQIKSANLKFKCELKVNPSFLAMQSNTGFTAPAGTIRFGAPV